MTAKTSFVERHDAIVSEGQSLMANESITLDQAADWFRRWYKLQLDALEWLNEEASKIGQQPPPTPAG